MKTLKLISLYTLLLLPLLVVVRCGDDDDDSNNTVSLSTLSGTVKYPNTAGVQTIAPKAVVILLGTSGTLTTLTDAAGTFSFPNLGEGEYDLSASFYVEPANARLNGLNFATEADVTVTIGADDVTQDLTLVTTGQGAEIVAMDAKYTWTGSAFTQTGTWTYDATHSPVAFEFPYRESGAEFSGAFAQLNKVDIDFDPADLAGSKIDVSIDLASFDTRSPAGRDPGTTTMAGPSFTTITPNTLFSAYGCIINGVFGLDTGPYTFTVTAANATAGATYTNIYGQTFTVVSTISGGTSLSCTAIGAPSSTPAATGTLTKSTGTGDATIAYTAFALSPVLSVATFVVITDADRFATFVSTSIAKYGDGYLAKGNVVFNGQTVPIELWFKAVAPYDIANTSPCSAFRTYAGFEGKFLMDAKNDFKINSSSLGAAIIRIQISIVLYKCKV